MKVALAEQLQRDVRDLAEEKRAAAFDAILLLPRVLGDPHRHAGLGLRKLTPRGVWKMRVGLGLRIVFDVQGDTA